jgi:hypothetical protein
VQRAARAACTNTTHENQSELTNQSKPTGKTVTVFLLSFQCGFGPGFDDAVRPPGQSVTQIDLKIGMCNVSIINYHITLLNLVALIGYFLYRPFQ